MGRAGWYSAVLVLNLVQYSTISVQYSTVQYLMLGRRPAPASPHTRCRQLTMGGEASLLTGEVFLQRAAR